MQKLFIAVVIVLGFSCTNERAAQRALEGAGYTDIEFQGYSPVRCGQDDTCTVFAATGPTGQRVHGAVGCGLACKGCTIRTF